MQSRPSSASSFSSNQDVFLSIFRSLALKLLWLFLLSLHDKLSLSPQQTAYALYLLRTLAYYAPDGLCSAGILSLETPLRLLLFVSVAIVVTV